MRNSTVMSVAVERFVAKMQTVKTRAAEAWGAFTLFGLFQREDTPGLWDVVVSAPWLTPDRDGIFKIAQIVTRDLTTEEAVMISRIVPLPPESDFVRAINTDIDINYAHSRQAVGGQKALLAVGPLWLGEAEIERGYILASDPTPPLMQTGGAGYEVPPQPMLEESGRG